MLRELAFFLCFDHWEILNPFAPQSKKIFSFYSRKPVDNEASTELFIHSKIDLFSTSVSMLSSLKCKAAYHASHGIL